MLGFNLKKYSLKLINKQIRHIFYFQISINFFLRYFLISRNEVIFYDDLNNFCKTYVIIYFSCTFFVCTLLMSQMHACEALITNIYQFQQNLPLLFDHSHTLEHFLKLWTLLVYNYLLFQDFLEKYLPLPLLLHSIQLGTRVYILQQKQINIETQISCFHIEFIISSSSVNAVLN